jgi:exonuclease III
VPTVLTWNVQGRVSTVALQAEALAERPADVVALQEVRVTSIEAWRAALAGLGYHHVATSLHLLPPERRLGVLVASRTPIEPLPAPPGLPWPDRVLSVQTEIGELVNVHAPLSSKPDRAKVLTLEAVYEHLAPPSDTPRILVGDLNTPQYESREGEVQSFARTRKGNIRPDYGERHDRAELLLITGLREHGYVDAFRTIHGYAARDRSWMYPNLKMGWRLDHIIVRGLDVEACGYVHSWRETKLSDHSGMWARLSACG